MHHFIGVLRKYLVFSGRASRSEYWYFTLFYFLSLVLLGVVDVFAGTFNAAVGFGWLSGTFFVLTLAPTLGVSIRRLHDIGRSGWWMMVGFVPVVGHFALLVITMFNSQPGENIYGAHPGETVGLGTAGVVLAHDRPSWMRRAAKGIALVVLVLLVVTGAGWYWWGQKGDEWLALGKAAVQEGQRAGAALQESGCVAQALHRHSQDQNLTLGSSVLSDLALGGCLRTSHVEASFCEGVPPTDEIMATSAWVASACSQSGQSDVYCSNLFLKVAQYCNSSERADKLSSGKKSALYNRLDAYDAASL